jgi:hypothetical protein
MEQLRNFFDVSHEDNRNLDFNVLYMNIHSLRGKMNELEIVLNNATVSPEVVVICETWLTDSMSKFYNLDGYDVVHNCREDGYAGLSIFIRNDLQFDIILNEKLNRNHFIMLNLTGRKFKLLEIYRDSAERMPNQFLEHLDRILEANSNCLMVGDLNIDLYRSTETARLYSEALVSNNFCILNGLDQGDYTYSGPHGKSLIDHIISDMPSRKYNLDRVPIPFSDHCMFWVNVTADLPPEPLALTATRQKTDFRQVNREISARICTDRFIDFAAFLAVFSGIVADSTKNENKRDGSRKNAPWMCIEVLLAISFRDYWYKRHKVFPNCEYIKENLRKCKNNVTKIVRKCKARYYTGMISQSLGNSRKMWGVINQLLYNRDVRQRPKIKEIQDVFHTGTFK